MTYLDITLLILAVAGWMMVAWYRRKVKKLDAACDQWAKYCDEMQAELCHERTRNRIAATPVVDDILDATEIG